ncbi:MAG: DUF3160 domain-containing protein [Deltaproteobacteria bacterium]|nr:DUF3160 domain-containing protein [Deltaproteobacteria bacterium]
MNRGLERGGGDDGSRDAVWSATVPPIAAAAGSGTGFDRFYSYVAPEYRVAGPTPTLPIPADRVAAIPALRDELLAHLGMDGGAAERLSRDGFVVLADARSGSADFGAGYRWLGKEMAVYVTSDSVLHLLHLVFDRTLLVVETEHLAPLLARLMIALRAAARAGLAWPGAAGDAARANLAVIEVVARVLDPETIVSPEVRDEVLMEVAAIEEHEWTRHSPVFGYDEDYTNYVPRGHYTRSEALERYFRAMVWLGRMTFLVRASDDPEPGGLVDRALARRFAAQSALFSRWLDTVPLDGAPAARSWDRIYRTTAFFVGFADDLTPPEVGSAATTALGRDWGPEDLVDGAGLDALRAAIAAGRKPGIYSDTGATTLQVGPEESGRPEVVDGILAATAGMRFMGQRWTPDGEVMGRLVFPTVGPHNGEGSPFTLVALQSSGVRGFARGLDVMSAMGSSRAGAIVETLGDASYENFAEAREAAAGVFPAVGDPSWRATVYWAWLDLLREVVLPTAPPVQGFQTTDAWTDRMLNTSLASWTELRHDSVLYVKQTGVVGGLRESEPPRPTGFVDPYPELYAKVRSLVRMVRFGLQDLGFPAEGDAVGNVLTGIDGVVLRLQEIAIRELRDEPLTNDVAFLSDFASVYDELLDRISGLGGLPRGTGESLAEDLWTTLAVDVQSNLWAGEVLEEGSGALELLVVAARIPGGTDYFIAAGPVFTHYEFRHPLRARLTDAAWRELLDGDAPPAHPAWTCSFRHPCSARGSAAGSVAPSPPVDAAAPMTLRDWLVAHGVAPRGRAASSPSARREGLWHGRSCLLSGVPSGGEGWLDLNAFQQALNGQCEAIDRCYVDALAGRPTLEGQLDFDLVIDERGRVSVDLADVSPALDVAGVVECIEGRLRAMNLTSSPPEGGEVRIRVPVVLALEW